MAIGNVELMHECFPKHLHMLTARLQIRQLKQEEGERTLVNLKKTQWAVKKDDPMAYL